MKTKNAVAITYWFLTISVFTILYFGISRKYFFRDKSQRFRAKTTAIAYAPILTIKFRPNTQKYTMYIDQETKALRKNKVNKMSFISEE